MPRPGAALAAWMLCALAACSQSTPEPEGLAIVFEDRDRERIAVCGLEGGTPRYITPDTLVSWGPVTDSLRTRVYFMARPRNPSEALASIYAVDVSGGNLRQLAELPISVLDLQVTPDATRLLFLGRYPDQEHVRAYLMTVGEGGFQAVTPDHQTVHDPAVAPGGLNFVWHNGTRDNRLYVSSLQQFLTIPFPFPYSQVSLSWPDGRAFAAVCGSRRAGLCYNLLQDSTGQEVRRESVLLGERDDVDISHPAFHPDGVRILFVETETAGERTSRICLIDRNSLKVTRLTLDCRRPSHPAWVRPNGP